MADLKSLYGEHCRVERIHGPRLRTPVPVLITNMPAGFVKAFKDHGFGWGGDWHSIKDPMHMSLAPIEQGAEPFAGGRGGCWNEAGRSAWMGYTGLSRRSSVGRSSERRALPPTESLGPTRGVAPGSAPSPEPEVLGSRTVGRGPACYRPSNRRNIK
jgi:hypothetical protein